MLEKESAAEKEGMTADANSKGLRGQSSVPGLSSAASRISQIALVQQTDNLPVKNQ